MESKTTPLASPDPASRIPKPQNDNKHHRRNHRSGVRERARRERREFGSLAGSVPATPTGSSWSGSIMGGKKKRSGHRAGLKYKARKERNACSLTADVLDWASEEGDDVEREVVEEVNDKEEAISGFMDAEAQEREIATRDLEYMEYIAPTYIREGNKKGRIEDAVEETSEIVIKHLNKECTTSMDTKEGNEKDNSVPMKDVEELEVGIEIKNLNFELDLEQNQNAATHTEEPVLEDEEDDDRAPSLTYDSDENHDDIEEQDLASVFATPEKLHQHLDIPVRERADTGSFQEQVEAEIGIMTPTKSVKEPPTRTPEMNSAVNESPKPRIKHEVKLLSLKRPEVLKGGNGTVNPHIKHEVKLLGFKRPEVLKGGSGGMPVVRERQHEVKLVSLMKADRI